MAVDPRAACESSVEPRSLARGGDFEEVLDRMGPRELQILLGLVKGITKIEHGRGVSAAEAAAEQVLDILVRSKGQAQA